MPVAGFSCAFMFVVLSSYRLRKCKQATVVIMLPVCPLSPKEYIRIKSNHYYIAVYVESNKQMNSGQTC